MVSEFRTSPDGGVIVVTVLATTVILVGAGMLAYAGWRAPSGAFRVLTGGAAFSCLAVLLGAYAYAPLGYRIESNELVVSRLARDVFLPLRSIRHVERRDVSIARSLRAFGSGGLFGYFGRFYDPHVGAYRAYARRSRPTVVLDTTTGRIVLTPDSADDFVARLGRAMAQAEGEASKGASRTGSEGAEMP